MQPLEPGHAGRARQPQDTRWRLSRLLTAPHRLGFFSAALMLATSALWWLLALAAGAPRRGRAGGGGAPRRGAAAEHERGVARVIRAGRG